LKILDQLLLKKEHKKKSLAILIDPDKINDLNLLRHTIHLCIENKVDYFFLGGSLVTNFNFTQIISLIKEDTDIPVILFPGNNIQIDPSADGILYLSLVSGRNPEFLIGQHVVAAPVLKKSKLEVMSTGYMLIDGSNHTAVSYMSNTTPIPSDQYSIAVSTAMAAEMLGMKLIYMDAGSGAKTPISYKMISSVRKAIEAPLIVGGGINSREKALQSLQAGADLIVLGNGIEKDPNLMIEVSEIIHDWNKTLNIH
jgi:phosphoglycerol geranylgeranyltransferase